ncbi:hypothetical protein MMC16_006726 [Acarospora aff. strigata]|nr:hypothetical protein [Acarospora aff. strigata]
MPLLLQPVHPNAQTQTQDHTPAISTLALTTSLVSPTSISTSTSMSMSDIVSTTAHSSATVVESVNDVDLDDRDVMANVHVHVDVDVHGSGGDGVYFPANLDQTPTLTSPPTTITIPALTPTFSAATPPTLSNGTNTGSADSGTIPVPGTGAGGAAAQWFENSWMPLIIYALFAYSIASLIVMVWLWFWENGCIQNPPLTSTTNISTNAQPLYIDYHPRPIPLHPSYGPNNNNNHRQRNSFPFATFEEDTLEERRGREREMERERYARMVDAAGSMGTF